MTTPTHLTLDDRFPRLFWRLDAAAHEAFARYGRIRQVPPGRAILREGEPSIAFYLVLEGEVLVAAGGKEIGRVGPNHSLGEMGMLLDVPRAGTATAASPTRLLEITRADIQAMQEKEPVWAARLYRVMAECLAEYLRTVAQQQRAAVSGRPA